MASCGADEHARRDKGDGFAVVEERLAAPGGGRSVLHQRYALELS